MQQSSLQDLRGGGDGRSYFKVKMISLILAYSRAPRHVQAASPSAGTKTLVSKWPAQDPLQGTTYERHQLS